MVGNQNLVLLMMNIDFDKRFLKKIDRINRRFPTSIKLRM